MIWHLLELSYESIAKDWIKLKSKRNAAKNGGQL